MATSKVSLKLLIDSKRQKVLFAEAGKDFVDFLFTLHSLPVGNVIRLASKDDFACSFDKMVEDLVLTYMQPLLNKDVLLKPKAPVAGPNIFGFLSNVDEPATRNKVFFMCPNCSTVERGSKCYDCGKYAQSITTAHLYVTEDPNEQCPECKKNMSSRATYVGQPKTIEATSGSSGAAGYVKDVVTYMIMDDLKVKPMSTISCIGVLNRFKVTDVGSLEEKVVDLSMNIEGVKVLLKESLQSKEVLTHVFLGKKAAS